MSHELKELENMLNSSVAVSKERLTFLLESKKIDYGFSVLLLDSDTPYSKEYIVSNNAPGATYHRIHAYEVDRGNRQEMYVFKNSYPDSAEYKRAEKQNEEEVIELLKKYVVKAVDEAPSHKNKVFKLSRAYDFKALGYDEIKPNTEYIAPNIKINNKGKTFCWHVYAGELDPNGVVNLYVFEHLSPNIKFLADSETYQNKNIEYLDLEIDKGASDENDKDGVFYE